MDKEFYLNGKKGCNTLDNIILRRATEEDNDAIYELNRDELGYTYDRAKALYHLQSLSNRPDHCILVAAVDGKVAGYIHANNYDLLYSDPMKNIMGIAVFRSYARMGVGRKLLCAVEDWAKGDGAKGIRLTSGSKRKGAHLFYESCGYAKNKEQYNFSKLF